MSQSSLPHRPFGATGIQVPIVGYGTAPLGKEKNDRSPEQARAHAERCLNRAIDAGITYIDTSPDYGSEAHVGAVMKTRRNEVFLATKINNRSKDGVLDELKRSLEKLQTDHVDLIQVHAVNAWADLEQALAPDGALTALEQARSEGLVRFIGITGHARPEILGHAIYQYAFDSVLVALGIGDRLVSSPENFCLPRAVERNVGVIAMKVFGHGAYDNRPLALRYSLNLPGVSTAIIGLDDEQQIDELIELVQGDLSPLSDEERDSLIDEVRPVVERDAQDSQNGKGKLFWLHDTSIMGWKQQDEPVMVEY